MKPHYKLGDRREFLSVTFLHILHALYVLHTSSNLDDESPDNYVSSRDIIALLKTQNLNWSDTKVGRELAKMGLVKEDKKIGGKTLKIWKGLKQLIVE